MTQRIDETFAHKRAKQQAAFLPYIMLGYPDPATSLAAAHAALDAGADGLELGVPFSDPLADGPTIQAAGDVALQQGMNLGQSLKMVTQIREAHPDAILYLMSYLNPLLAYGLARLCRDGIQAGLDGLIVPDLPPEEEALLREPADDAGLTLIHLLAPTTPADRLATVAADSEGMLYLVSVTGVTGARGALPPGLADFVARVRRVTDLPLAVGFGISTPAQAKQVATIADGVIVGSALLQRLGADGVKGVAAFVAEFVASLRNGTA